MGDGWSVDDSGNGNLGYGEDEDKVMHFPRTLALCLVALAVPPAKVEDLGLARAVFGDPLPKIDTFEWPTRLVEIQPSLLSFLEAGEGRRLVLMVGSVPELHPGGERAHQVRLASVDQPASGVWRSAWTLDVTKDLPFELVGPGHCLAVWGAIAVGGSKDRRFLFVRLGSSLSGSGGFSGESLLVYYLPQVGTPTEVFRAPRVATYGAAGVDASSYVTFELNLLDEDGDGQADLLVSQAETREAGGRMAPMKKSLSAYLWTGAAFAAKGRPVAIHQVPASTFVFKSDFGVKP